MTITQYWTEHDSRNLFTILKVQHICRDSKVGCEILSLLQCAKEVEREQYQSTTRYGVLQCEISSLRGSGKYILTLDVNVLLHLALNSSCCFKSSPKPHLWIHMVSMMEKANPLPNADVEGPFSSEDGSLQLDYAAEQKLVRKLDVRLSH